MVAPSSRRRRPQPAPAKPQPSIDVPPGGTAWVLDVPYEERGVPRAFGAHYHPGVGNVYIGDRLPPELGRYAPKRHSWHWWASGTLSRVPDGNARPDPRTGSIRLRPDQRGAVEALLLAHAAGAPEFLNGSGTGVGKTYMTIAAVKALPSVRSILVVAPLSVLPAWRASLERMGDGGKRWCLINYQSLGELVAAPPTAAAKKAATRSRMRARAGKPVTQWDVVIADESHYVANPAAQQSKLLETIITGPNGRPAFVVRLTATVGANPAKLSYLHRGLAWRTRQPALPSVTDENFQRMCATLGVTLTTSGPYGGLEWTGDPTELATMNRLIFGGSPRWAIRVEPDWAEQQRFPIPVDLTAAEAAAYDTEWRNSRAALAAAQRDSTSPRASSADRAAARGRGLGAQVRYRQKVGLIMAPHVADYAATLVKGGTQPVIACEFLGTATEIVRHLEAAGIPTALFTGANTETREAERTAFQRGVKKAIVFTVCEGINLQAGEAASAATSTPRATLVAEPRWSPIRTLQVEGRAHRDGNVAHAYYFYAAGTVAERVIKVVTEGMRNVTTLMGADTTPFTGLAAALGVTTLYGEGTA